jgi:hypothetical protein
MLLTAKLISLFIDSLNRKKNLISVRETPNQPTWQAANNGPTGRPLKLCWCLVIKSSGLDGTLRHFSSANCEKFRNFEILNIIKRKCNKFTFCYSNFFVQKPKPHSHSSAFTWTKCDRLLFSSLVSIISQFWFWSLYCFPITGSTSDITIFKQITYMKERFFVLHSFYLFIIIILLS